jgi:N-formylglutamate amidohydrolase
MVLHIPHSSTIFPNQMFVTPQDINLLTDWYTDELFVHPNSSRVVFPYSRLFCDVERYRNDEDEPMFLKGHGVVYSKGATGNLLERPKIDDEFIKREYYDKHHNNLSKTIRNNLTLFNKVVLVDCHSFYSKKLVHEESEFRPDFCLGFNRHFDLVDTLAEFLSQNGYSVGFNNPFVGAMIPSEFIDDVRTESILIEVNRGLYLNEKFQKTENFNSIKDIISGALNIVNSYEISFEE